MKAIRATLHPPWLNERIRNVKRRRLGDSAGGQSMICEAKVFCCDQEYYMAVLDSDVPGFRLGRIPIICRGEEGFKSDDGLVSRCYGLDAYDDEYGDTDIPWFFQALYQMMDEDDDSVVFKRSGDIAIGKYAIALRDDCWWDINVIRILDALIDSWGTISPFAVATANEGPDMFVFSGKHEDVMHVVEGSKSLKVGVTDIKFEVFRDSFMLGLKRFVRHTPRKPERECQLYTEQLRRQLKRRIKAYDRLRCLKQCCV
jgi:hypothetical protein